MNNNIALSFKELNNMLVECGVENVIFHLTGNVAKRTGNYLHLGDVYGQRGNSLAVYISGANAGHWIDNATGQRGDLVEFWVDNRMIDKKSAYQEIINFLGIQKRPSFDSPHLRVIHKTSQSESLNSIDKT